MNYVDILKDALRPVDMQAYLICKKCGAVEPTSAFTIDVRIVCKACEAEFYAKRKDQNARFLTKLTKGGK